MKRFLSLLMLSLLILPVTGCKKLREFARSCANGVSVSVQGRRITTSVNCSFGAEQSGPVSEGLYKAAAKLDRAIDRDTLTGGLDECGRICATFGPDSDECDQCRSSAGIAIMNPTIPACQGTSYAPLPQTIVGALSAETNRGTQISPGAPYTFSKSATSIGFDGCGGEKAEYIIPDDSPDKARVRNWSTSLVDGGVRQVTRVETIPPSGAEGSSLFSLKDDSSECLQLGADPLRCGVFVGGFIFDSEIGESAHGFVSERMLPRPAAGVSDGYYFAGSGSLRRR